MKKIGFFILIIPVLVAYGSRGNAVGTAQAPRIFETTRTAQLANQGVSDISRAQTLILLLVTLAFAVLFVLAMYLIARRLIRIGRAYHEFVSSRWIDDPDAHSRKTEETDL
ncbi:MAG: hypothetical protein C3F13_16540 [Anaerolineales bacterium]|nr:hypothetical protein [Anaerolineae bacterium]PWB50560.1 MAG: hypothetical protein C3F13_16540 [Anaerolineales bacterium]